MFELEFLSGARAGETIPVTGTFEVGRDPSCALTLSASDVSRVHARFEADGTRLTVHDNGSFNGTFVNDRQVTSVEVASGDTVRLGNTQFRVRWRPPTQEIPGYDAFDFQEESPAYETEVMAAVADLRPAHDDPVVLAARLKAVFDVSMALAEIRDLEAVTNRVLECLFEVFPQADRGFLMLGNDPEHLEARAVRQRAKDIIGELKVSTSICRRALESKSAVLFNHTEKPSFKLGRSVMALDIRNAMTIPLVMGDEVEGLLQIDTPDATRPFTRDDLELAVAVAQQVAIALHNAQLLERVEKETTTRKNLVRFLPGPLVDQAVKGEIDLSLGGRSCAGTLLFSDVVGFTRLSELLEPEAVVTLMNRYFDRMVPCIQKTGGAIDKYMGDAIMAFWGIPFEEEGSAASGVESALAMQTALAGFNNILVAEGTPAIGMGIGLNSGPVVAGNIGSRDRTEYTVLGDTVNTAQRIEATAGRTQTLVGASTWRELEGRGFGLRMPPRTVKNKVAPLDLFSLRGLRVDHDEVVLHLPVRSGDHEGLLIRRLGDSTFVILHPEGVDPTAATLVTAVPEWPGVALGVADLVVSHGGPRADGGLARSQIRLGDTTLSGLLGPRPVQCLLEWADMRRV
jgi:adenylate cyclase